MMRDSRPFARNLLALSLAAALGACTVLPRDMDDTPSLKKYEPNFKAVDEVVGQSSEDVIDILPSNIFISTPMAKSEPLPNIEIRGGSFSGANASQILKAMLADKGISVVVRNETQNSMIMRHTVSTMNLRGTLKEVLDRLSDSIGFYYSYRNGVLEVTSDMQFIAAVPPLNSLLESLPGMLHNLGATEVFLDRSARTLTYRATKPVHEKVAGYLNYLRETRSLIVYDTYIYEVVLNDANSTGISWNRFRYTPTSKFNLNISGPSQEVTGGIGVGVTYNTASFALDVLAKFLQTQGTVRTVSQPKIQLVNGTASNYINGTQINYISQIGSTTTGVGVQTSSVTSAQVLAGISMTVSGDIYDSTVWTGIDLRVNSLVRFDRTLALGVELVQPQLANKSVITTVRGRSSDTILLAGINSERTQVDHQGLPLMGKAIVPTSADTTKERVEMVIVMRPRIIRFATAEAQQAPAGAGKDTTGAAPAITSPIEEKTARGLPIEVLDRRPQPSTAGVAQ